MKTTLPLTLLVLSATLFGCGKKTAPVPPPTPEAIAAFAGAAFNGDTLNVTQALDQGMPVDQLDKDKNSALMLAAFNGHIETMQTLLDAGADVTLREGNTSRTALMFAASGPFPSAVKLLLKNGAEINAIDSHEEFTALMFAASEGLSPIVDILLAAGADPTLKDTDGDAAGDFAQQRGFPALAAKLHALEK